MKNFIIEMDDTIIYDDIRVLAHDIYVAKIHLNHRTLFNINEFKRKLRQIDNISIRERLAKLYSALEFELPINISFNGFAIHRKVFNVVDINNVLKHSNLLDIVYKQGTLKLKSSTTINDVAKLQLDDKFYIDSINNYYYTKDKEIQEKFREEYNVTRNLFEIIKTCIVFYMIERYNPINKGE